VIVSRDAALTEVAGGAALQADTAVKLAAAMEAVVSKPDLRAKLSDRSLARARQFSWSATAALTHEVYREAVARFGR
jgi:glycosyltransferase involved in cell wall biosynthesis